MATPEARPLKPSIMLKALDTPAIARAVKGNEIREKLKSVSATGTSTRVTDASSKIQKASPERMPPSSLHLGETLLVISSASPLINTGKADIMRRKNSFAKGLPATLKAKELISRDK